MAEKIPVRAGSLIVWSSDLIHANCPNDSERFRMVQYMKMFPAREGMEGTERRRLGILDLMPETFSPSELGKKLYGMESWGIGAEQCGG